MRFKLVAATLGSDLFEPELLAYTDDLLTTLDNDTDYQGGAPPDIRSDDGCLCLVGASDTSRWLVEVRRALAALAETAWRVARALAAEAALANRREAPHGRKSAREATRRA